MPLHIWLTSSLVRNYPQTPPAPNDPLVLRGARNEQMSCQLVLRLEDEERKGVRVEAEGPQGWSIRVRRVGYVPVCHHNTPIDLDTDSIGAVPASFPILCSMKPRCSCHRARPMRSGSRCDRGTESQENTGSGCA